MARVTDLPQEFQPESNLREGTASAVANGPLCRWNPECGNRAKSLVSCRSLLPY